MPLMPPKARLAHAATLLEIRPTQSCLTSLRSLWFSSAAVELSGSKPRRWLPGFFYLFRHRIRCCPESGECSHAFVYQRRTAIDQARVELNRIGARGNFFLSLLARGNASHANNGHCISQLLLEARNYGER